MKILYVSAKCSDMFALKLTNVKKNSTDGKVERIVGEYDGYVPNWFPNPKEEHCGDYVNLEIDVETGKIINWKTPTIKDLSMFESR